MNDLIEQYKAQIEALQKEVQKKDNRLQEAKKLLIKTVELIENQMNIEINKTLKEL